MCSLLECPVGWAVHLLEHAVLEAYSSSYVVPGIIV